MPVSREEIDRAKTVDLRKLVGETVALEDVSGPRIARGDCPFCKKARELHVNHDRGFFYCYGCRKSGSAIDFVMLRDGVSFADAVARLSANTKG
jgi:DNA primase